jgi:1-acyl-sn-glycerol-3-phosphate acyltransferase
MFPEGTRPRRPQGKYKAGGSRLAGTKALVVPWHELGRMLAQGQLPQEAGVITVSIGKPISPEGLKPQELNERVENWIESEMRVISPDAYKTARPGRPLQRCFQRCCRADP